MQTEPHKEPETGGRKPVPVPEIPSLSQSRYAELSDFTFGMSRADFKIDESGQPLDPAQNPDRKFQIRSVAKENFSGLSAINRYDDRTLELIASFLTGSISTQARAELTGRLIFPGNPSAAALVESQVLGKLKPGDDGEMVAAAMFPDNRRMSRLYADKAAASAASSLQEMAELYSFQLFRDSPALAAQSAKEIVKTLGPAHEGKMGNEERRSLLLNFVRRELELCDRIVSTSADLAAFFATDAASVEAVLGDPRDGLGPDQLALRAERLMLSAEQPKQALAALRVHALRNFVALENDLHRTGVIDALSSTKSLAELLGVSSQTVGKLQRLLPDADRIYRNKELDGKDELKTRAMLMDAVRREISAHGAGKLDALRTDADLAASFELKPVTVSRLLDAGLSAPEKQYRRYILRSAGAETAWRTATELARAELEAVKLGEICTLSTAKELAAAFHVDASLVESWLREPAAGLSADERKSRDFILRLQNPNDLPLAAYQQLSGLYAREAIERAMNRSAGTPSPAAEPEEAPATDGRPRTKINFKGMRFDSYEEAVCALMLARYVPGFEPIEGRTYQVPAAGRFLDFVVNGTVVEYHPPRPYWTKTGAGSFKTREEYESFNRIKMSLRSEDKRKMFIEETKIRLAEEYRADREKIIRETPALKNAELIVADSPEDFYYSVLRRFGENVPSRPLFQREFNRLKARVRRENQ